MCRCGAQGHDLVVDLAALDSILKVFSNLNGSMIRKHFFTMGAVKHWNRLPREEVNAPSLSVLKRHLDNALNNMLHLLVSPGLVRQLD